MSRILHRGDSMHSSWSSNASVAMSSNYRLGASGDGSVIWSAASFPYALTGTPSVGASIIGTGATTAQWSVGSNVTIYWPLLSLCSEV